MKSNSGRGANWRVTRLSGITPFCLSVALLVIAMPSHAQVLHPCKPTDANSNYHAAYDHIVGNIGKDIGFWKTVTAMGGQPVPNTPTGLGIWNTSGTKGPGIVSESMGYAMILAALYDDRATFDRLSATVQAGINYGDGVRMKAGIQARGLFPWYWTPQTDPTRFSIATDGNNPPLGLDSASDADINIALAYVYADIAVKFCGWSNPTPTYFNASPPYFNSTPTYQKMARDYIAAIRQYDFSTTDTIANNHILADGYTQAGETFSKHNWHPDYSDIRAYQLFKAYDPDGAFWDMAISTTISCWKGIFNFSYSNLSIDPRTTENPKTGQINPNPPSTSWVKLSNPVYQMLQANSDYSQVTAIRGDPFNPGDDQFYTSDSQRLPIRLLNYINATQNPAMSNSDNAAMFGVASANLTALGTSYKNTGFTALADKVSIVNPYPSNGTYIQNRTAAGVFAYASNNALSYVNRNDVYMDLLTKFGNGTNGTISLELDAKDGFNALLTLWALTVSTRGGGAQTPLQQYILSQ